MRFGVGAIAPATRLVGVLCLYTVLVALVGMSSTVAAQGSTVNVSVNSGTLHPSLELTKPSKSTTVTAMPLRLGGSANSLTQIQVYVDNSLSVIIPLDDGATTFSYDLVLPSGVHQLRLDGISPFADTTPAVSLVVTYTPSEASPEALPTTVATTVAEQGGAVISRDTTPAASTSYVPPSYASSLPSWFYNGLIALDIASPSDTDGKELAKTVQRIVLAGSGLFLIAFAQPSLFFYRTVRYSWLGLKQAVVPQFLSGNSLAFIRILGGALFTTVFLFV